VRQGRACGLGSIALPSGSDCKMYWCGTPPQHLSPLPPKSAGKDSAGASEVGTSKYNHTIKKYNNMAEKKQVRKRWLTLRMNDEEYAIMEKYFKTTTCREMSDYVRRLVLNKPVNIKYRNASIDDFLTDMTGLKRELNAIGNNFNQAVHRLHQVEHIADFQFWLLQNEKDKSAISGKMDQILSRIEKLYQLWSQS
jgi:hypothetical protein